MSYNVVPFGKTYITGDTYFNDELEAKNLNLTIQEYNNKIVNSINKVVKPEDTLIIIGEVGTGDFFLTEQLLRLHCDIIILNTKIIDSVFNNEEYTNSKIFTSSIDGVQSITVDNKDFNLIYCAAPKHLQHFLKLSDVMRKSYIAAATSQGIKDIFKDRILNISLSEWGYEPLEISERIPQIISDMNLFESMKAKGEIND